MTYTTNYNLKKPEATDPVDIGDLNDNSDIIDENLGKVREYTLTAEVWDETPGYMWINGNATDNPYVWLYATADLTAEGQPLENAFITGVEVSSDGNTWVSVLRDCSLDYFPQIAGHPALITETTDDFGTCTAVIFGNKSSGTGSNLTSASYIKIHFIKTTDGGAV